MATSSLTKPFFVIRNSIHDDVNNYAVHDDLGDQSSSPSTADEVNQSEHARVSIVRLSENPDKGFYLDFGGDIDNDLQVNEFVENGDGEVAYLDEKNWQLLGSFACLIGKADVLSGIGKDSRFVLKKKVEDVLNSAVPLERLFSWDVLVEAREREDLSWRDIRALLNAVRQEVVFLTKDGILKAYEPIQLSFLQFAAFARLVYYHLSLLPNVKCRVVSTYASAVDIKIKSSHRCLVLIGLVSADSQIYPTSLDLQHHSSSTFSFASWKSIEAVPGLSQTIKVDSLEPNTSYSIFLRVDRNTVVSSDDDVLQSRVNFVTDCQAIIFPTFESMSFQEQKTEILACINDKSVRKEAPVVPKDLNTFVSIDECSQDWKEFIRWWLQNNSIRTAFLTRELMFAASDEDIRRQAVLSGISMKKRASKDPKEREMWSNQFAAWYYGLDIPSDAQPGEMRALKPTTSFYASPHIQHYEFESDGNDEIPNRPFSSYRGLGNRVLRAPVIPDDDQQAAPEESSQLKSPDDIIANAIKEKQLQTMDMTITSMQRQSNASIEKIRASPLIAQSRYTTTNDIDSSPRNQSAESRLLAASRPTRKCDDKRNSAVDSEVVIGAKAHSQRVRFLVKVTQKVSGARRKAEQMTGSSSRNLRGINLFRSKVRLVVLLMKLSSTPSRKSVFRLERDSAVAPDNVFDIFDFDEAACDFDALKKNQPPKEKPHRYDPDEVDALRRRNDWKLLKKSFGAMVCWKNNQMMMRRDMNAKIAMAREAYTRTLLKRIFRMYQAYVRCLVKERVLNEQVVIEEVVEPIAEPVLPEEDVVESTFGIRRTHSFEMRMLSLEDELASKFREKCVSLRVDQLPFLPAPRSRRTKLGNITMREYDDQICYGIEVDTQALVYYGDEPINLYDGQTSKSFKREKLKAGRGSVNIFDVPSEVLSQSLCVNEDFSSVSGFRMREKVNCLAEGST